MRTHTFTTSAATFPLHAIDPRGFTAWEHGPDEFDREQDEGFCPACDDTAYMLDGSRCPLCNDPETVAEMAAARATPDFSEVCDDE